MSDQTMNHFKVIMLGDSGVGKTALVNRVVDGVFTEAHVPTVGSQFISLPLEYEGTSLTFELWDTAGQEVYRSLVGFYSRDAKGAFLLFDVTNDKTFLGLREWINFANEATPGVKIIIGANKIDLVDQKVITDEQIDELSNELGVEIVQVSAKTGEGTRDLFDKMSEVLMSFQPKEKSETKENEDEEKKGKNVNINSKDKEKR